MIARPKILTVDDKRENLFALRKVLSDLDVEIFEAGNGNEALTASLTNDFAVAILDVHMPEMDGFELAELLRSDPKTASLPIVFVTADYGEVEHVFRGYESGAVDYIVKPYNPVILRSKIGVFVELHRRSAWLAEKVDALAASEERFRSLVMTVPDIVYRIDSEGRFTFLNDAVQRLGYSREDLLGQHFSEIMLPGEAARVSREAVLPGLLGKEGNGAASPKLFDERRTGERRTTELEVRLLPKQGSSPLRGVLRSLSDSTVVAEVSSSGLYSSPTGRGTPVFLGSVGVIRDITERKAAQMELERHREELERLVNERVREQSCLYAVSQRTVQGFGSVQELLEAVVPMVEEGLKSSAPVAVRIGVGMAEAKSGVFAESEGSVSQIIEVAGENAGRLDVVRLGGFGEPSVPASLEETRLIAAVAEVLGQAVEKHRAVTRQRLSSQVLGLLNRRFDSESLVPDLLDEIHRWSGFEASLIRVEDGEDYPLAVTRGLHGDLREAMASLICKDDAGEVLRDESGRALLSGFCGIVARGETSPDTPWFSKNGSFWTNSLTKTWVDARKTKGGACKALNHFESVALVPIRAKDKIVGLLELFDRRIGKLSLDLVHFLEDLGSSIGVALERRRAHQSVAKAQKNLESILDSVLFGVAIVDMNTKLRALNGTALGMLGYENADELLGRTCHSSICPSEQDKCPILDLGERIDSSVRTMVRKDGTRVPIMKSVTPIVLGGEELLLESFMDITENVRAEEEMNRMRAQMIQSQRLESIGTLASGVAHEINNPLNIVMNFAQMILDDDTSGEPCLEYAKRIVGESERMAQIVKNLLAFSRNQKEIDVAVDMASLVQTTLSLVRASFRRDQIDIACDFGTALPQVQCRKQQIQQVLMNLLTNARDAVNERFGPNSEEKRIVVRTSVVDEGALRWIRLQVEDNGGGISAECADRLFDPFFTTKPKDKGTGLGLSISYGIVKEHDGRLHFDSTLGVGTTFMVDLKVDPGL